MGQDQPEPTAAGGQHATARMILTCPRCATRYFVEPGAVPLGGRSVRCAACGDSWRATPEPEPALEIPLDLEPTGAAAVAPTPLPQAFRAKVEAKRRMREAIHAGAAWAALGAAMALVLLATVLWRREIVRLWPRTAGVYATLRLPVNPTGLSLDAVEGTPGLANGRVVMVVSGLERNIDAEPRRALPVRAGLFDKAGRRLASRVAMVAPGLIAPGETRAFRAVFVDPPLASEAVGADFSFSASGAGPPAVQSRAVLRPRPTTAFPSRSHQTPSVHG